MALYVFAVTVAKLCHRSASCLLYIRQSLVAVKSTTRTLNELSSGGGLPAALWVSERLQT
jgi:hypothetical protein